MTEMKRRELDNNRSLRILVDATFEVVKRLFVLAFNNTNANDDDNPISNTNNRIERNSHRKYFLPRGNTTNCNVLINVRNFYDQPIGDQIKKYDTIRKIAKEQGDDYTTGCFLDY